MVEVRMSGGFAIAAGDGSDDNAGRGAPAFEGSPGLRVIFAATFEYAGLQLDT